MRAALFLGNRERIRYRANATINNTRGSRRTRSGSRASRLCCCGSRVIRRRPAGTAAFLLSDRGQHRREVGGAVAERNKALRVRSTVRDSGTLRCWIRRRGRGGRWTCSPTRRTHGCSRTRRGAGRPPLRAGGDSIAGISSGRRARCTRGRCGFRAYRSCSHCRHACCSCRSRVP